MTEPDDTRTLVELAKRGDRQAFDALVERISPELRARVTGWNQFRLGPPLEIEEVLQDTVVRALRAVERFEWQGRSSFLRWLCGIAKNSIADSTRQAHRNALRRGVGASMAAFSVEELTQSRVVRRGERFERLQRALDKVAPDRREVLVLARIDGLTIKEIAERLGRSPDSVKHLLARGLRDLKKHFGHTESFHLPDRQLNAGVGRAGARDDE